MVSPVRTALVVVTVLAVMGTAGCATGSDTSSASADSNRVAAEAWAEPIGCPASPAELTTVKRPPVARSGTDMSILPPGEVTGVVRCDEVAGTEWVTSADGQSSERRGAVQRTVLLDDQPLSWFSDGDHWPTPAVGAMGARTRSAVYVHYASGSDVVVVQGGSEAYRATDLGNGVLTCSWKQVDEPVKTPTCRVGADGAPFAPVIRRPVADAPPADCPAASDPQPAASTTSAPRDGLVVAVFCSTSFSGVSRAEVWGVAAERAIEPQDDANGRSSLCFPEDCVTSTTVWLGFTSRPPQRVALPRATATTGVLPSPSATVDP